jgi:hypothetical protein
MAISSGRRRLTTISSRLTAGLHPDLPWCRYADDGLLAAAKARGVTLGNPKIDEAREKAVAEIVDRADQRAANVIPIMRQIQHSGATSLRQIAEALNARGINAPRGGQWHATSVRNVMARALA